jgi:hypothetical protein
MQPKSTLLTLLVGILAAVPTALGQISISNGEAFLAGTITAPGGMADIENKLFACTRITALEAGAKTAAMVSSRLALSLAKTDYEYPIIAIRRGRGWQLSGLYTLQVSSQDRR